MKQERGIKKKIADLENLELRKDCGAQSAK